MTCLPLPLIKGLAGKKNVGPPTQTSAAGVKFFNLNSVIFRPLFSTIYKKYLALFSDSFNHTYFYLVYCVQLSILTFKNFQSQEEQRVFKVFFTYVVEIIPRGRN
jgi:hypothetical protein